MYQAHIDTCSFYPEDSMASTLVKRQESKMESKSKELETVEEEKENHTPSIYGIAAARSLSKDIKQKSLHLMKVKRRHGDWGQFDLTHAWSPEDFMSVLGSRHGSGLTRDSSPAEDSLAMARPFVMEPLRIFQVCWDAFGFLYGLPIRGTQKVLEISITNGARFIDG